MAIPAACSPVNGFSLSVKVLVGGPARRRSVDSRQAINVGTVSPQVGITHPEPGLRCQAGNSEFAARRWVAFAQSHCSHNLGSGIRADTSAGCPASNAALASATAQRVVR